MCKDYKATNIRLQCLKLAYKNSCKNHNQTLAIAKKNISLVLNNKSHKKLKTKR
jgi:hypothetical protein